MASVIQAGTASNTALTLSSDTSGELQLKTNNGSTTAMTLTTGGLVGIGTTSPSSILHIASSSQPTFKILYAAQREYGLTVTGGATTDGLAIRDESGSAEIARFCRSGNVGIGTSSPSYPLHVSSSGNNTKARFTNGTTTLDLYCGGAAVYTGTANSATSWEYANNNTYIAAFVNSAERMRIDSSGNVGIGTNSPGVKVDNTGSFRSTGVTDPTSGAGLELCYRGTVADVLSYNRDTSQFTELQVRGSPIAFLNSGGERMRITAGGLLGIGTTNPNGQVEIVSTNAGANTNTLFLTNASSNASTATSLVFGVSTDPVNRAAVVRGNNTGGNAINLQFLTSNGGAPAIRGQFLATGALGAYQSTLNGPYVFGDAVTYASNATVNICSLTAGALVICVYDQGTGDGGVFFATYISAVTKIAGSGEATDTGSTFAVYKSVASHTVTFRNRYGISRNICIAVYSANAVF